MHSGSDYTARRGCRPVLSEADSELLEGAQRPPLQGTSPCLGHEYRVVVVAVGMDHDLNTGAIGDPEQILDGFAGGRAAQLVDGEEAVGRGLPAGDERVTGSAQQRTAVIAASGQPGAHAHALRQGQQHGGAQMGVVVPVDVTRLTAEQLLKPLELVLDAAPGAGAPHRVESDAPQAPAGEVARDSRLALAPGAASRTS